MPRGPRLLVVEEATCQLTEERQLIPAIHLISISFPIHSGSRLEARAGLGRPPMLRRFQQVPGDPVKGKKERGRGKRLTGPECRRPGTPSGP